MFKEITDSFINLHRYRPHEYITKLYNPHLYIGKHNYVNPFTLHAVLVVCKNPKRIYLFLEFITLVISISFLKKTLKLMNTHKL